MANNQKGSISMVAGLVLFVALIGGLIYFSNQKKEVAREKTSREVTLECTTDMATTYHVHPEIRLFVLGEEIPLPTDIGIKTGCMNAIHTHDDVPLVHVESPVQKDFTLGDFFASWGKEFNQNTFMDLVPADGQAIHVTVNGEHVDTFENTILRDKDKITVTLE